jgi:hypothetical protein
MRLSPVAVPMYVPSPRPLRTPHCPASIVCDFMPRALRASVASSGARSSAKVRARTLEVASSGPRNDEQHEYANPGVPSSIVASAHQGNLRRRTHTKAPRNAPSPMAAGTGKWARVRNATKPPTKPTVRSMMTRFMLLPSGQIAGSTQPVPWRYSSLKAERLPGHGVVAP